MSGGGGRQALGDSTAALPNKVLSFAHLGLAIPQSSYARGRLAPRNVLWCASLAGQRRQRGRWQAEKRDETSRAQIVFALIIHLCVRSCLTLQLAASQLAKQTK